MTSSRHRVLDRIRKRTAAAHEAAPIAESAREHLYGSTYAVKMSFAELMATRGYIGHSAMRRSLGAPNDARRQRDNAARRAGYAPGEVLWPST